VATVNLDPLTVTMYLLMIVGTIVIVRWIWRQ
jgi:hypothetical protein